MKRGGKMCVCLLGSFALALGARAITGDPASIKHGEAAKLIPSASAGNAADTPYGAIVERNIFDLKDPPPPPDTNAAPVAPPPNITLTGIMTIFQKKQAMFMVQKQPVPGKTPSSPESYIMTEGQRQDGLEVLEIDVKGSKVKIKNDGIVSTITFEAAKGGAGGPPGTGGMPQPHMGGPGFNPNMMNNPNAGSTPLPTRPLRNQNFSPNAAQNPGNPYTPNAPYSPQGAYNQGAYNQGGYNSGGITPVGYGQGMPQTQQQQPITAEQSMASALQQQQQHADEVSQGKYPTLPNFSAMNQQQQSSDSGQQENQSAQNPASKGPIWAQPTYHGTFQPAPGPSLPPH